MDYTHRLERIIGSDKNTGIEFKGAFPIERLGGIFADVDVLVVPSEWHENNPRVIQEAFACKIPVVASDVGGISEFDVHDQNGLLFKRGDPVDLRMQLTRFMEEPDLLERLSSSIARVKTMDEEVKELLDLYDSLLNNQWC